MNETLIENWNDCVGDDDSIWHLGDFAFCGGDRLRSILGALNGKKGLILGNHDKSMPAWAKECFHLGVHHYRELRIEDSTLILFHYPMHTFEKMYYGAFHLFGHVHGTVQFADRRMDVGVDANNFRPISYQEVKEKLGNRECPHESNPPGLFRE